MPKRRGVGLEPYLRGQTWWVKGRVEGIDTYFRESLGTANEQVARAKVRDLEAEAVKRVVLGRDAPKPEERLTFSDAALLHDTKGHDVDYMRRLILEIGDKLVSDLTPKFIKTLARKMYPNASTDTWHRQVIVPVRAVINNAHQEGLCPPVKIKAFTKNERMAQDRARGKDSRVPKKPGSWEWVLAFKEHAEPRLGAMALFMFTTGARIGQTRDMKRKTDLDLFRKQVRLPAAKGHPAQWIPILPEVAASIGALEKPEGVLNQERVFYYAGGGSGWFYREWKRACIAAGIEYIAPHAAGRHGFGTETVVRQGIDPRTAADQGRWSSAKVLLDTYSHSEQGSVSVQQAFQSGLEAARTSDVQKKTKNSLKPAENKGSRSA